MIIDIRNITSSDIEGFNRHDLDGASMLEGRKALTATDENGNSALLYVAESDIERLGMAYLRDNITIKFSEALQQWQVFLSQNNYYNDPVRYPEKVIDVKYVEDKVGERTEIYRCKETGRYYMRTLCNEPFAKWYSCHPDSRYQYTDDNEIRANIIFRHGAETERITYDDWNGNAAYSGTFNPNFR